MGIFPNFRGEHKKSFLNHHLGYGIYISLFAGDSYMQDFFSNKSIICLVFGIRTQSFTGYDGDSLHHSLLRGSQLYKANVPSCQVLLLMEEILHRFIGSLSHYVQGLMSQVVQDFFHQQYVFFWKAEWFHCLELPKQNIDRTKWWVRASRSSEEIDSKSNVCSISMKYFSTYKWTN